MQLSGLDRFLWAATFFGEVLIFFVLLVRHRARSFPWFTAFIAENVGTTIALYFVFYHFSLLTYAHWYWYLGILDEVLQLLVLYEVSVHVFCPTGTWAPDVRKAFLSATCACTVIALLLTWLANPTSRLPIQTFVLRSNFFSSALMSELFASMILLSATAGLPWKTHVARIAQGLGAYSFVCVATFTALNYLSAAQRNRLSTPISHIQIMTFLGCEIYWAVMLWQEAPAPRELPESMRIQIYTLQKQVEYDLMRIRTWRRN